jgi:hypothetical protein
MDSFSGIIGLVVAVEDENDLAAGWHLLAKEGVKRPADGRPAFSEGITTLTHEISWLSAGCDIASFLRQSWW